MIVKAHVGAQRLILDEAVFQGIGHVRPLARLGMVSDDLTILEAREQVLVAAFQLHVGEVAMCRRIEVVPFYRGSLKNEL